MSGVGWPSLERAVELLSEAEAMNPGPWVAHSRVVAAAAGGSIYRLLPSVVDRTFGFEGM